MHKYIRLGDTEAVENWIRILLKVTTFKSISDYLTAVIFEDSRAFQLYEQLPANKYDLVEFAKRLTLSPKKWELEYLQKANSFNKWLDAYFTSLNIDPHISCQFNNLTDAYISFWIIKKNKTLEPAFWEFVRTNKGAANNAVLQRFLLAAPNKGSYSRMICGEILVGVWDNTAIELNTEPKKMHPPHIPCIRSWVWDIHTRKGYSAIKSLGVDYCNNNFDESRLDLRASGAIAGLGFRNEMFRRGLWNTQKLPSWKKLNITAGEWQKWLELDMFFYSKLSFLKKYQNNTIP